MELTQKHTKNQRTFLQYLIFWAAQQVSILGSSVVQFAGAWWVTTNSENPIFMVLVNLAIFVPQLVFGLISGVVVDKFSRKTVILMADSYEALLSLVLVLVFWNRPIDMILLIILLGVRHIGAAFHGPAVSAIVPMMVPEEKLSQMNGVSSLFRGVIQIASPFLGALCMSFWTLNQLFWIDVITFIIGIIPLIFLKIPEISIEHKEKMQKASFKENFTEGLRTIKETRGLALVISTGLLNNFLITPMNILLSYFIYYEHGGSATNFAMVSIFPALGMIAGSLLMSVKKNWKNKRMAFLGAHFILYIPYIIMGLAPKGWFYFIGTMGFFFLFSVPILNTFYLLYIQLRVPKERQGRVIALDNVLSAAATPIAMGITGAIANTMAIGDIFLFCGIVGIVCYIGILITKRFAILKFEPLETETDSGKMVDEISLKV